MCFETALLPTCLELKAAPDPSSVLLTVRPIIRYGTLPLRLQHGLRTQPWVGEYRRAAADTPPPRSDRRHGRCRGCTPADTRTTWSWLILHRRPRHLRGSQYKPSGWRVHEHLRQPKVDVMAEMAVNINPELDILRSGEGGACIGSRRDSSMRSQWPEIRSTAIKVSRAMTCHRSSDGGSSYGPPERPYP